MLHRSVLRFCIALATAAGLWSLPATAAASDPPAPAAAPAPLVPFEVKTAGEGGWGYRDAAGAVVVAPRFAYADEFSEGLAAVWVECGREEGDGGVLHCWGFIDSQGSFVIPPRFEAAGSFADGRAPVVLDGEVVFVDSRGRVSGQLRTAAAPLPPPADGVDTLEAYGAQLGAQSPAFELKEDPIPGERGALLTVRALGCGVTATRIRGWEGVSDVLSIPGLSLDEGLALARRLTSGREWTDVTGRGIFQDDVVLEDPQPEAAGTFIRVRPRRGGGVEIEYVVWYG